MFNSRASQGLAPNARTVRAVADRFQHVLERLAPEAKGVQRAEARVAAIRQRLDTGFATVKCLGIGSHTKRTAIRNVSDVDLLVVVRREEVVWGDGIVKSSTLLNRIKQDLTGRFVATVIERDGVAVVLNFGAGQYPIDVVPGYYAKPLPNGQPLYGIPNGAGGWMPSCPEYHRAFFRETDERSGHRLSRVVQLVKDICHARTPAIPLSSFYLELVLALEEVALTPGSYSAHLSRALQILAQRQGAALRDPLQISGLVPATSTDAKRLRLRASLGNIADHAAAAHDAELTGDTQEAIRQWRIVFNDGFPT